jgi:hypothetical protein
MAMDLILELRITILDLVAFAGITGVFVNVIKIV